MKRTKPAYNYSIDSHGNPTPNTPAPAGGGAQEMADALRACTGARHVTYKDGDTVAISGVCQWYRDCTRPATGTLAHPTLGEVAICTDCRARYERLNASAQERQAAPDPLAAAIAQFPATFGLRAFPGDVFRISARSSYLGGTDNATPMLYTEILYEETKGEKPARWNSFAKGTVSELKAELIALPTEVK